MAANQGVTVVVGVDGSPHSDAAIQYAADLADRRHAPLRVVHAFQPFRYELLPGAVLQRDSVGLRTAAQRAVDGALAQVHRTNPEVEAAFRLEPGSAGVVLVDESRHAHTVVVGRRGSVGLRGLASGSTALHLATLARCPIVVVPELCQGTPPRHRVVVGVDGSAVSEAAIEYAFKSASESREPLVAVHASREPAYVDPTAVSTLIDDQGLTTEARLALAESLAGWAEKYPDVEVQADVVRGHPVQALIDAANSARLLVVGRRGRGDVLPLGSVSQAVMNHADCPVAVVTTRA